MGTAWLSLHLRLLLGFGCQGQSQRPLQDPKAMSVLSVHKQSCSSALRASASSIDKEVLFVHSGMRRSISVFNC
eukprot:2354698-Amphidinium_carterae.1